MISTRIAAGLLTAASITTTALTGQAAAQDMTSFGLEAGVSTLGIFVAPDFQLHNNFHLRTPIYFGNYSDTYDYDGNDVETDLSFGSVAVMADYYVMGSGFRVSGGIAFGGYDADGIMRNPTIDGNTLAGDITGTFKAKNHVSPVLSVGYRHMFNDNWGMVIEGGARFTQYEIQTEGQDQLPPGSQADFEADIQDIQDDLDDFPVVPYISLGLTYNF
ncbi:hypothetical protein [Psychromarinibacter sp. S121]|uniref:hypothetical protein n=1 Tax=Psychromarinibacter sp. S121 TaxID=3415127 RepID=UPI003C7B1446